MPLHPPSGQSNQGHSIPVVAKMISNPAYYSILQQSIQEGQRQGDDITGFHSVSY